MNNFRYDCEGVVLLIKSGIDSNLRAQDLSLNDWQKLTVNFLDLK